MSTGDVRPEKLEDYSGFSIQCGGEVFTVHKAVLCRNSDYFARMVEGRFLEARTGTVTLPEDNPEDISRMIEFLYHRDYDDGSPSDAYLATLAFASPSISSQVLQALITNAAMYAIGDKYLIPPLKKIAAKKFRRRFSFVLMDQFSEVLAAVYNSTPQSDRTLRSPLLNICLGLGYNNKNVFEALDKTPDAHVEVLKEMLSTKEITILEQSDMLERDRNTITVLREENAQHRAALQSFATAHQWLQAENRQLETKNESLLEECQELRSELDEQTKSVYYQAKAMYHLRVKHEREMHDFRNEQSSRIEELQAEIALLEAQKYELMETSPLP